MDLTWNQNSVISLNLHMTLNLCGIVKEKKVVNVDVSSVLYLKSPWSHRG